MIVAPVFGRLLRLALPSRQPAFALDRIWMHPADRLIDATVHRSILPRAASGHLPLVARIAREHH
ncbi:hypothetical protein PTKU46_45110 [Paraburkholderia terrae]